MPESQLPACRKYSKKRSGRSICRAILIVSFAVAAQTATSSSLRAQDADLILTGGKIVTVDGDFHIAEAVAIRGERILLVGSDEEVLAKRGADTRVVQLQGKMVLPGLIDSHTHPTGAAMHEFDHDVPDMETIDDVLAYVAARAAVVPEGQWIWVRQVFITRLREQRYPTREELDRAAPRHPVVFATGPDAMLNSMALSLSGIDKDFRVTGTGYVEKDADTGEPTGLLRSCSQYIKGSDSPRQATPQERLDRVATLFSDYNSVGLTSIADRNASPGAIRQYAELLAADKLSVRVAVSHGVDASADVDAACRQIREVAEHPLVHGDSRLRIVGIKTFLDGGMLTGSAYMREPWGTSDTYLIDDPKYRGVLFIEHEKLVALVKAAVESKLQFTAHSVGDGAVHALLDAYEEVNRTTPIAETRPCITHSNFMSREAIEQMARLGVVADIQPAWLYLDSHTLAAQFGYDRLRYFQPLHSLFEAGVVVGGGSDHMQKIGSLRSINPYNPFLGMWVAITRKGKSYEGTLHAEEALTRQEAIRFYTINNAHLLFLEKETGSIEPGKLADLIVLDRDLLECPIDDLKDAQVLQTYVGSKLVFERR